MINGVSINDIPVDLFLKYFDKNTVDTIGMTPVMETVSGTVYETTVNENITIFSLKDDNIVKSLFPDNYEIASIVYSDTGSEMLLYNLPDNRLTIYQYSLIIQDGDNEKSFPVKFDDSEKEINGLDNSLSEKIFLSDFTKTKNKFLNKYIYYKIKNKNVEYFGYPIIGLIENVIYEEGSISPSSGFPYYRDTNGILYESPMRQSNLSRQRNSFRSVFFNIVQNKEEYIFEKSYPYTICLYNEGNDFSINWFSKYKRTRKYILKNKDELSNLENFAFNNEYISQNRFDKEIINEKCFLHEVFNTKNIPTVRGVISNVNGIGQLIERDNLVGDIIKIRQVEISCQIFENNPRVIDNCISPNSQPFLKYNIFESISENLPYSKTELIQNPYSILPTIKIDITKTINKLATNIVSNDDTELLKYFGLDFGNNIKSTYSIVMKSNGNLVLRKENESDISIIKDNNQYYFTLNIAKITINELNSDDDLLVVIKQQTVDGSIVIAPVDIESLAASIESKNIFDDSIFDDDFFPYSKQPRKIGTYIGNSESIKNAGVSNISESIFYDFSDIDFSSTIINGYNIFENIFYVRDLFNDITNLGMLMIEFKDMYVPVSAESIIAALNPSNTYNSSFKLSDFKKIFNIRLTNTQMSTRGQKQEYGVIAERNKEAIKNILKNVLNYKNFQDESLSLDISALSTGNLDSMYNYAKGFRELIINDSDSFSNKTNLSRNLIDINDISYNLVLERYSLDENKENIEFVEELIDGYLDELLKRTPYAKLLEYNKFPTDESFENYLKMLSIQKFYEFLETNNISVNSDLTNKVTRNDVKKKTIKEFFPYLTSLVSNILDRFRSNTLADENLQTNLTEISNATNDLQGKISQISKDVPTLAYTVSEKYVVSTDAYNIDDEILDLIKKLNSEENSESWRSIYGKTICDK